MQLREQRWTESIRLPDGHRIFKAVTGGWAVADNSGRIPEDTDDGVLWLDFDRPIRVVPNGPGKETLRVPVKDLTGVKRATVTDVRSMFLLSEKFGWGIETKDARYSVCSVDQHA